jgi:hypothetical protein
MFITAALLGFQHPALRMSIPQRAATLVMSDLHSDSNSDASSQVRQTP